MSWGVALRNAVGLGLGGIPSLLNAPPYAKLAFNFLSGELDPRITFSRTSNATLIGSNGTLQYAPHNLLTYSEQFDNAAWSKFQATISANTITAPDGTTTADSLIENVGAGTHVTFQNVTTSAAASQTISIYAKANQRSRLQIFVSDTGANAISGIFNLSTGTVVSATNAGTGTDATATITPVGADWYRCVLTGIPATSGATVRVHFYLMDNTNNQSYTGDGVSGIYVWGAQLNVEALQPYYQTEASAYYGPRFDYDPVTLAPKGLLIEEQRTNLAINSGDVLSGTGGVVVADQITAPDGSLADFFQEDTNTSEHYAGDRTPSVTAGTTYTWSFYAKLGLTGEARRVCVRTGGQGPGSVVFDLETGSSIVIAPVVSSGISSAGNGWFRCWIVYTATGTGVAVFRQQLAKGANTVYTGDGTSGLFFWGAQMEVGAFPTSYIPTTTAAATRAADIASVTGANFSNWYNQAEGTLLAEATTVKTSGVTPIATAQNSGGSDRHQIIVFTNTAATVTGGVTQSLIGTNTAQSVRTAYAYKVNDFAACTNGGAVSTDTTGSVPTVNYATLGKFDFGGGESLNGHIRSFKYYPTRLSNGQLQTLTK